MKKEVNGIPICKYNFTGSYFCGDGKFSCVAIFESTI